MEKFAAILNRLSTAAVLALILTGFTASISSVVNAEELTVAMVNVKAATEFTNADQAETDVSTEALSNDLIEEVRENLARRLRTERTRSLEAE